MTKLCSDDAPPGITDFDRTTALTPIDGQPGEFLVHLDPGWSSLVGVHGGYLCATAVRAAEAVIPGRPVRTMATSFLRTAEPGPAALSVRTVRTGRSVATLVVDLVQDDRAVLVSRVTLMPHRAGPEWSDGPSVPLPPPEDCVEFTLDRPVEHFARAESRFDPADLPFAGTRARVAGYLRPLERRPLDAAWLVMASDWFPPPAFARVEPPTGGVSIDLVTHVHRTGFMLDGGDWLAGEFEVRSSVGGMAVEHGRLTLMDGTPVVESMQTRLTVDR